MKRVPLNGCPSTMAGLLGRVEVGGGGCLGLQSQPDPGRFTQTSKLKAGFNSLPADSFLQIPILIQNLKTK